MGKGKSHVTHLSCFCYIDHVIGGGESKTQLECQIWIINTFFTPRKKVIHSILISL